MAMTALGADGVIVKPFDPMHLAEDVRALARRPGRRVASLAAHALVMADHLVDDEAQEFLREVRIEMRRLGEPAQPRDLLLLAPRIGGRQLRLGLVAARPTASP